MASPRIRVAKAICTASGLTMVDRYCQFSPPRTHEHHLGVLWMDRNSPCLGRGRHPVSQRLPLVDSDLLPIQPTGLSPDINIRFLCHRSSPPYTRFPCPTFTCFTWAHARQDPSPASACVLSPRLGT